LGAAAIADSVPPETALAGALPLGQATADGSGGGEYASPAESLDFGGVNDSRWLKYAILPAASVISARRLIARLLVAGRKLV
jgi:hypothetical protein